jgi:SAM-dependent methyltransferase
MKEDFDKYLIHYGRMGNHPPDYALAVKDPQRFHLATPWLPQDQSVPILDVGCGWGHLLLGLWASGFRNLTGVELSKDQFEIARQSLPLEIRLHNANARDFLKLTGGRYGLVTAFDLIEHLSKEEGLDLLRGVFRVLEPGGSVVIRTPNMANILATYTRYMDITHVVGYTEWSLFQLLDLAGFSEHQVVPPTTDLRYWRWYVPFRGFGLRERLAGSLQSALYRVMGLRPRPTAFGFNLTVQSYKK